MGFLKKSAIGLVAIAGGAAAYDLGTFDRAAWQADYASIKRGMAQNYGNLDWVRHERKLDLVALDKSTT